MEVFVDDETKLTLHGLRQHYCKLNDNAKNRELFELLDALEFNQVSPFFVDTLLINLIFKFSISKVVIRIYIRVK